MNNAAPTESIAEKIYILENDPAGEGFNTWTVTNEILYDNAAPVGFARAVTTPTNTGEKIYDLENDNNGEGFNTWIITNETLIPLSWFLGASRNKLHGVRGING